jgi:hypothetical protein
MFFVYQFYITYCPFMFHKNVGNDATRFSSFQPNVVFFLNNQCKCVTVLHSVSHNVTFQGKFVGVKEAYTACYISRAVTEVQFVRAYQALDKGVSYVFTHN